MAVHKGIYQYDVKYTSRYKLLPSMMEESHISSQGILIQLVIGKADIRDQSGKLLVKQDQNYSILPPRNSGSISYTLLSNFFGVNIRHRKERAVCNQFLLKDRKNDFVYRNILNELSQYFVSSKTSPMEGFIHLYRMLEFMSYCFPLMYASTTMDYKGSFSALQSYLKGDTKGELGFFKKFIDVLFKDEPLVLKYSYSQYVDVDDISMVEKDLKQILKNGTFDISGNTISFEFCEVVDIFITIRNRYFHMLVGQGQHNFYNTGYDINKLFEALNPAFLSWLIMVFTTIEQHGIELFS